jgi:AmmeMemoRadiSam system protein B
MDVRCADFAGSWYPGNKSDCRSAIEELSDLGLPCPSDAQNMVGGIVPHAGWFYSGKIACSVIQCVSHHSKPDTCIIFGRHLRPGSKNFIMIEGQWATPLGNLEIDGDLASKLVKEFRFNVETSTSYEQDNTIELQLPFLKYFFPFIKIVPIGLPPNAESLKIAKRAADISKQAGRKTFVLGSTDLTHYGYNYGYTPKGVGKDAVEWVKKDNDKRLVDLLIAMDAGGTIAESLKNHNACCSGAAAAAIEAAKTLGANRATKIAYSTSYDIRANSSFVGYVGVVFHS